MSVLISSAIKQQKNSMVNGSKTSLSSKKKGEDDQMENDYDGIALKPLSKSNGSKGSMNYLEVPDSQMRKPSAVSTTDNALDGKFTFRFSVNNEIHNN